MNGNILWTLCFSVTAALTAQALDWPQYRADAARGGHTAEVLPEDLALAWAWHAKYPPDPAWTGVDTRMFFDHAYQVVIAGGQLFLGTSADGCVYALDAATGALNWTFYTDGPVRFAPAVWRDRVFVISDDGRLYCLSASDGALLWKKGGGPDGRMFLGNDRMISRWPARGGIAIVDDTVYFAAGIWPSEGIYLYALDTATGETRWLNDSSGSIEMDQPHPTAHAKSGVSVQGYLVAAGDVLLAPTGRAVPAAFNRLDGAFRYFRLQEFARIGGGDIVGVGDYFVNAGFLFDAATGEAVGNGAAQAAVASPTSLLWGKRREINALNCASLVVEQDAVDRKGEPVKQKVLTPAEWAVEIPKGEIVSMIMAGDALIRGTDDNTVTILDSRSKKDVWHETVDGVPHGLAVADGRLYVSTDRGIIHCFGAAGGGAARHIKAESVRRPYGENAAMKRAAKAIIDKTGVTEGYCVDLGCGDGALTYELAKRTSLRIIAIEEDAEKVRLARERLDAAGLYGVRATVHQGDPANTPYAPYFANLIVSKRSLEADANEPSVTEEWHRLRQPYHGVGCTVSREGWTVISGGPPDGVGDWTHQYGTPANTCASKDTLARGPLSLLWFRDTDYEMSSRHGRGPSPLFSDGRLFVEGLNGLRVIDAYNGRTLWEFPLPDVLVPYDQEHLVGTAATNSNMCLADGVLYVRVGSKCLRLDAATGKQIAAFPTPAPGGGEPGAWGYIACVDGLLYGSVCNEAHIVKWAYRKGDMRQIFSESSLFFAMDCQTGALKWTYTPTHSIRHNAIAIGGGRVFLIDHPRALGDLLDAEEEQAKRRGEETPAPEGIPVLLALDAATGEERWRADNDIYGTLLALSVEKDVLLMTQQHTRFKLPSEAGGRMSAFRASDGTRLWDVPTDPREKSSRPLLIGGVIYNEPGAWDLLTGKRLDFHLERSYGCGIMSGCENLLLYRSATLGYTNPKKNEGTINYGGIRPGCWINAIPVGGLVLMPDATARCTCSYLIRAWAAFQSS